MNASLFAIHTLLLLITCSPYAQGFSTIALLLTSSVVLFVDPTGARKSARSSRTHELNLVRSALVSMFGCKQTDRPSIKRGSGRSSGLWSHQTASPHCPDKHAVSPIGLGLGLRFAGLGLVGIRIRIIQFRMSLANPMPIADPCPL